MAQEAVVETIIESPTEEEDAPLLICKACNHLVPRTIVCLWCGARIEKDAP
jgi:hypothetical protein